MPDVRGNQRPDDIGTASQRTARPESGAGTISAGARFAPRLSQEKPDRSPLAACGTTAGCVRTHRSRRIGIRPGKSSHAPRNLHPSEWHLAAGSAATSSGSGELHLRRDLPLQGDLLLRRTYAGFTPHALELRTYQPVHQFEIPFFQMQGGLYPDLGDIQELLVRNGVNVLPAAEHRLGAVAVALVTAGIVVDRSFSRPVLGEDVYDPQLEQFLRRINPARQNHFLGALRSDAPREQTIGSHAGEQIEQDLWQAHLCATLRNHDVARQRCFKPPSERVALHEGYRRNRSVVVPDPREDVVNAQGCITHQAVVIVRQDELSKRGEVSAEVVDALGPRGENVIVSLAQTAFERDIPAAHFERVIMGAQVRQKPRVEAGGP